ncbi:RagB/SusD family nutrient uptake outer membrane protein [Polaribacter pectinis]|uniref:RagB/SusD family nutrient uptake outer membrane protein n=1 Tax=Polaribacter pectinis TaxID=2738844 RepID=A0A7G9L6Q5_9FLAO|nr:RagB/SusD family nutrient uptake outer membrane protein [Polaribacter pectinis]QNM84304.1 RagB/SusD family nutrient uptake outer membrane protein [Polaribacter pectinis]
MKKLFILLFTAVTIFSCSEDFLDQSSQTNIAESNFWKSETDAFLALNAVYSTLQSRNLYGGTLNGGQGLPGFDCLSDNAFNAWKWEGPGKFMEGTLDPSYWWLEGIWNDSYQAISRINSVVKNVNEISEDLVSAETKKELLGQAYFLRALTYFNLAVYFEEVPLILAPQTLKDAYVAKNTYEEINSQIIEDLKFASKNLPVSHSSNLLGYATKGAALGLFARVQLYNKEYNGEFGVLNLTQQAIGLGYSLHSDYEELFTTTGETSSEIVFAVRFLRGDDTGNGEMFSATYKASPKVDQQPMPNLVNDYYCIDGLPITSSPLYNPADKKQNRDPRAVATFFFKGDIFNEDLNRAFNENLATKFGQRKYIRTKADAEGNNPWNEGSQDFYIIRYADILLMRAEALAETGDVSGAMSLINKIRGRVGMPKVEDVEGPNLNQSEMIALVRHERRVELALEGLRFMDLKRWGEIENGILISANDPIGPYNPQYLGEKSKVFPIPQAEIDVNPNLLQHHAW